MNSEYGRRSLNELKQQARQQAQTAEETVPCVAVTEKNWSALLALQKTQTELLLELTAAAQQLATREQMEDYLNSRMQVLEGCAAASAKATGEFQTAMKQSASETVKELSLQAGRISENFSQALSLEQDRMKKFSRRLFWISLIPTAVLVLSELIWHILPLI